jgi:hypothetical protein
MMSWRQQRRLAGAVGAAIGLLAIMGTANAGVITTYTSRGAFPGNDSLDWGQLGVPFTVVPAPFSAASAGGQTINVTQPGNASFERRNEGGVTGWVGTFTIGEHLLWNQDNSGQMNFSQTPISGFGTAIQADAFGPYSATLSAFAGATLLGSLTVSSNNTGAEDGTAPFAGISDSVAEITSIVITANAGGLANNGFAIDSLSLQTVAVPAPVIGGGLPAILGVGGILFGARLLEGSKKRRSLGTAIPDAAA